MAYTAAPTLTFSRENMVPIEQKTSERQDRGFSIKLETLQPTHYEALFPVVLRAEPWGQRTYMDFVNAMSRREGFVVMADSRPVGCISFSDCVPEMDITIHCFVDPDFHGRWVRHKGIYRQVFGYVFDFLELPRCSGFAIQGLTDKAGRFLEELGFTWEGIKRDAIKMPDGRRFSINLYGMLRDERRF